MSKETVTISKEEYERLLDRDDFLNALEITGVDNWEGYWLAKEYYEEMEDNDE